MITERITNIAKYAAPIKIINHSKGYAKHTR